MLWWRVEILDRSEDESVLMDNGNVLADGGI